jgi:putative thioredoxin
VILDATDETFYSEVLERSHHLPVVVDFWAAWCGPCRSLTPVLEREAEARAGKIVLAKVDVDANPALARHYEVQGIPAVKAFRGGKVVREFVGAQPPATVASFFDALLDPPAAEPEAAAPPGEPEPGRNAAETAERERVLASLLEQVRGATGEERDRLRQEMLAIFEELGQEDPLTVRFRRQLATVLY